MTGFAKHTSSDYFDRRAMLQLCGWGALGTSLDSLANCNRLEAMPAEPAAGHFGRAKACILLFLFGSPSQHETFDPKPQAPEEVRGEMRPISTAVPGLQICEGLPRTAQIMDRVTVVRSMTHQYPLHGVAYALTGAPTYSPAIEDRPRDPSHWPFIGSIVDFIERQRTGGRMPEVPHSIGLPWLFGSRSTDKPPLSGPYGAFLGNEYDPVWTNFDGRPTRVVPKLSPGQSFEVCDHFAGIEPEGRFNLFSTTAPPDPAEDRIELRRQLLSQLQRTSNALEEHRAVGDYLQQQQAAYSLLTSPKLRQALDVAQEGEQVREEYGLTLFGQSALAARRLVQTGCKFVSVFWDPVGPYGISVWDTHANQFPRLKNYLLPVFDQTYPALIRDLERHGLLDETLVVCVSEHGRTPRISSAQGGGRDHWSRAYSAVLAGGGIGKGQVVGRTDKIGGDVDSTPVSPKDILATSFHLLGIDPHTLMKDRLNRPLPIAGAGVVRHEFF